jgi:hypothetical protein
MLAIQFFTQIKRLGGKKHEKMVNDEFGSSACNFTGWMR